MYKKTDGRKGAEYVSKCPVIDARAMHAWCCRHAVQSPPPWHDERGEAETANHVPVLLRGTHPLAFHTVYAAPKSCLFSIGSPSLQGQKKKKEQNSRQLPSGQEEQE